MRSRGIPRALWLLLFGVFVGGLLPGCAVSTPYPQDMADSNAAVDPVVLVVTRVVVDKANRAEFDRQTQRVMASMSSQPGLIGFSARRQLFGDTGWTMSVWKDDKARARFVQSEVHQQAIAKSMSAVETVEIKRLSLARGDIPRDWVAAINLLSLPEANRNYLD